MDQRKANTITKGFGCVFIVLGGFMLMIGLSLAFSGEKNSTEYIIMALSLLSGALLIYGAFQNFKKSKEKDQAINAYEEDIQKQIKLKTMAHSNIAEKEEPESKNTYHPDLILSLSYTKEEWKIMNHLEVMRRLKEGVWVSLAVGLLGTWVLHSSRNVSYLMAFIISTCLGALISILKVFISTSLFSSKKENTILFTTNALIINGKFKTLHDNNIYLHSVKHVVVKGQEFVEFYLEWETRSGLTNDQIRIYFPPRHTEHIQSILDYYSQKGVPTK